MDINRSGSDQDTNMKIFINSGLYLACFLCLLIAPIAFSQEASNLARINGAEKSVSVGTGFFVSDDGYLITANHVIHNREKVLVRLRGNILLKATIIKVDAARDLALLKIYNRSTALSIANWGEIPVGLEVYVIGYPLPTSANMGIRITEGLINGAVGIGERKLDLFQLSAQVQKGNSGGPVLSPDGLVVGVVQGKLDALQVAEKTHDLPQNVNFALKSSVLMHFLEGSEYKAQFSWVNLSKRYRPYEILRLSEQSIVQVIGVGVKE